MSLPFPTGKRWVALVSQPQRPLDARALGHIELALLSTDLLAGASGGHAPGLATFF